MFIKIINRTSLKFVTLLLAFAFIISCFSVGVLAAQGDSRDEPEYNKPANTTHITSKTAAWTEPENYLAELTLSVNGSQVLDPLDVVIVLDRSGSMDMTWAGNRNNRKFEPTYGYPGASCPCLNQEHFFLPPVVRAIDGLDPYREYQCFRAFSPEGDRNITVKYYDKTNPAAPDYTGWLGGDNIPTRAAWVSAGTQFGGYVTFDVLLGLVNNTLKDAETGAIVYYDAVEDQWYEYGYAVPEPEQGADKTKGYDIGGGKLAVYKGDYDVWVEVDATQPTHLYFAFGESKYIPYHFKMENNEYKLISYWDSSEWEGIWKHGVESEGCFDRWMEAKEAVSVFAGQLLDAHPDNNVAFVPFSVRDSTMVGEMNGRAALRDWIISGNPSAFGSATGVTVGTGNLLTGTYKAWIDWTDDISQIDDMLPRLFTTGCTDYMYGLSMAYNLLCGRSDTAKENKRAVVVFISDGVPYSMSATNFIPGSGSVISAFYNPDAHITGISNAIKSDAAFVSDGAFWASISGSYQRHDVNSDYLLNGNTGVAGLGAQMVTVSYMIEEEYSGTDSRLKSMASDAASNISISPNDTGSTEGYLAQQLLDSSVFPGGREAVLRDEVSKYFYVPDGAVLPAGVTIEGTIEYGQTIVWDIGTVYQYSQDAEPTITVPLVLREAYRDVEIDTYYPTNADDPEPSINTPESDSDGADTGAQLTYKDPYNKWQKDTIGTPKLAVMSPKYTYTVEYYKDSIATGNLLGTENGDSEFTAGYQLSYADVETDLGAGWLNLYKQDAGGGYYNGTVQNGYPLITVDVANNVVRVLYVKLPEPIDVEEPETEPTAPTEPPTAPTEPTTAPTEPTTAPTEPTTVPTESPTVPPAPPVIEFPEGTGPENYPGIDFGKTQPDPTIPGGSDPEAPPVPTYTGNALIPQMENDEVFFIEIDEYIVPLGEWHYGEDDLMWLFDEYPPLSAPPQMADNDMLMCLMLLFGLLLAGLGACIGIKMKKHGTQTK